MRRNLAALISLTLTLWVLPATTAVAANPKAGAKCTKAKQVEIYKGKSYTCIESGKKLTWSKGKEVASAKTSSTPTPTPTPSPSATDLPAIRAAALANNTLYVHRQSCSAGGIAAELQALKAGRWEQLASAMGWDDSNSCDVSRPFQPWVAMDIPAGTTLRWRFSQLGKTIFYSETFMSLIKNAQTNTSATPVATPSPSTTVKPAVTPTPSATVTRPPLVAPTPTSSVSIKPTSTSTPTPTPSVSIEPTSTPTPTSSFAPLVITQWFKVPWEPSLRPYTGTLVSVGTSIFLGGSRGNIIEDLIFNVTGSNCLLIGNELSAKDASTCTVVGKIRWGTDAIRNHPNNSATQTFNFIQPVDQQPLVINAKLGWDSSSGFAANHLDSFKLSTSGGSGGATSYTLNSGPYCSLSISGYLYASQPTTCVVTARMEAIPGFKEVLSLPTQFTFRAFSPSPIPIKYEVTGGSKAESMAIGETANLETTFPPFSPSTFIVGGNKRFSVSGNNCVLSGFSFLSANARTTCVVTATQDAYYVDTLSSIGTGVRRSVRMYYSAASSTLSFVFDYRDQAPLSIAVWPSTTAKAGETITLYALGGSGTGAISWSVISGACSIGGLQTNQAVKSQSSVTATGATTCVITAT